MGCLKFLIKTVIVIAILCIGLYFVGKHLLFDKAADTFIEELENNGQLDQVRNYIDGIPELKRMLESSANADVSTLPFTTREAAIETVVKRVGVTELYSLKGRYEAGMSPIEQFQVIQELEGKLSADEMEALKYVLYHELY